MLPFAALFLSTRCAFRATTAALVLDVAPLLAGLFPFPSDPDLRMKQGLITEPTMGEVRVDVKLTNLFDWEKAEEGKLPPGRVRTVMADAMVDTGAVRCVLPPHVVKRLGLKPRRTR